MFMPMNINGIPYTADYMHFYRQTSHQVSFIIFYIYYLLNYILNIGRPTN